MSDDVGPLGLRIPQRLTSAAQHPCLRPKDAEKWIAALPVAHIGEVSRLVYRALVELNRVELPVATRFKLLELFQSPVNYVTRALEKHFVGQSFPLPIKNRKIVDLARELQAEMAIGYKIIVETSLSGFSQRIDAKVLLHAVYYAIGYLNGVLIKSYQTYSTPPELVWSEIHHLFLFAEHNELHTQSVTRHSTIEGLYKRILLLALANPYRLPQKDIERIYMAAEGWAGYTHLLPLIDRDNPPGLFGVDMERDGPPAHYAPGQPASEQWRILDTEDLTRLLRGHADTPDEDLDETGGVELDKETLRRLILAWGGIPKRSFSRTGKNAEVLVALGISATHHFITKHISSSGDVRSPARETAARNATETKTYTPRAQFFSVPVPRVGETQGTPDIWEVAENPTLQIETAFDFPTFNPTPPETKSPAENEDDEVYKHYVCHLTNESPGGCCLLWKSGVPTKTVVGMLVGICQSECAEHSNWAIGVIRWMKHIGASTMVLGVEMLAPSAEAVGTCRMNSHAAENYMRSLLLPELRTVNQPETIITPALYKEGETLSIELGNRQSRIRLTKLRENTGSFSQFQFAFVGSEERAPKQIRKPADQIDNFDSIWSSI